MRALPAAWTPPAACHAQIAVLKETDGRGPYSSLIMGVVIVKDVLVFACFAVNIETSRVVRCCVCTAAHPPGTVCQSAGSQIFTSADASCSVSIKRVQRAQVPN
jgi:hypothetical protein